MKIKNNFLKNENIKYIQNPNFNKIDKKITKIKDEFYHQYWEENE